MVALIAVVLFALSTGADLFKLHCASCHGLALQGSVSGPPLVGVSARAVDFMLSTGRMPMEKSSLQQFDRPPAFPPSQIRDIVAYVVKKSHGKPELPVVEPGDPIRGRTLFAQNCAECHGAGAQGASVGFSEVAPSLIHSTVEQLAEAPRFGPGIMPVFGRDVLSRRDLNDIIAYVGVLQRQGSDAGGVSLGDEGPVAEGFIGWLFGLGALMLFVRFIGSTK